MQSALPLFTLVHVILSVVGIVSGLVVVGGFLAGVRLERWVAAFLVSTVLTNATGFGFPFSQLLPSHVVAVLSLAILPFAFIALYGKHLQGWWREVFVAVSVAALYLNVFVLMAQLLQKVPALATLAPHPGTPAFALTQLLFLALFIGIGWASVRAFGSHREALPMGAAARHSA